MLDWEELIVTCDGRTDRPRYVNEHEIPNWDSQDLDTLLAEWRAHGWELVEAASDLPGRILTLRRPRLADTPSQAHRPRPVTPGHPWRPTGHARAHLPGTACRLTVERRALAAFDAWWHHVPDLHDDPEAIHAHVASLATRFAPRLRAVAPELSLEEAQTHLMEALTLHAQERLRLHQHAYRRPWWQVWHWDDYQHAS